MNTDLLNAVKQIVLQEGEAILSNPRRVSGFLSDLAGDVPKPHKNCFVKCLEYNAVQALKNAPKADRASVKQKLAQKINGEEGLDLQLCLDSLALLITLLFGVDEDALEAEIRAEAAAKAEAEAVAQAMVEAAAKAQAEARAKAEAEIRAKIEAETRAKVEAEAAMRAKVEAEVRAKIEAETKAKVEAEMRAKAEATAAPPPKQSFTQNGEWFVMINGQQRERISKAALGEMFARGEINRNSLVWKAGIPGNNWTKIENVSELKDILTAGTQAPAQGYAASTPSISPQAMAAAEAEARKDPKACFHKANTHSIYKRYDEAFPLFLALANQGYVDAMYRVGYCYYSGSGTAIDYAKAAEWYRKGAELGDATAQGSYAGCIERGHGVPKDEAGAIVWFRKAAEQGDSGAQYQLGNRYSHDFTLGIGYSGVALDYAKAAEWYRKAAAQGDNSWSEFAQKRLDKLKQEGKI